MGKCKNCGTPYKEAKKGSPEYMLTYGDMMTLLLCFFVMMYTTATVDGHKFKLILSAFRGSFYILPGGKTFSEAPLMDMGQQMTNLPAEVKGDQLDKALQNAVSAFKAEIADKRIRITEDERGVVITFASDAYFKAGSAQLTDELRSVLTKVSSTLMNLPNHFRVEGHTSDRPLTDPELKDKYPTNWELSTARAVNVLKYLVENKYVKPYRISAAGYGAYRPIESNETPEGRAMNRRVDLIILRERVGRREEPKYKSSIDGYLDEIQKR
jgi:chemotaxis protein MotB